MLLARVSMLPLALEVLVGAVGEVKQQDRKPSNHIY
jgi:hypothetical protein